MNVETCDFVVVGAGPGGYAAAAHAARNTGDVVLVEQDASLGGTCLLRGCIPTKSLLQSARTWELCRKGARTFGIAVADASFDWEKVQKRKAMVVRKGSLGVQALLAERGVRVVRGRARLAGPGVVVVNDGDADVLRLKALKVILATGSSATALPQIPVDGRRVLTSDHLLELTAVPASLIVLGGGAVGVEFADVMSAFGCKVTLVEMLPRILPLEEPEASAAVAKALQKRGVAVLTDHRAVAFEPVDDGVRLTLRAGGTKAERELNAERLLVAVGRRPNTDDIGLDTTAAVVGRRGFVQVDGMMETAEPGLYAIGDIVATAQLAHVASAEARVAVDHALGREAAPVNPDMIPGCTYCTPEVASVGLTEAEARSRGHEVLIGRYNLAALGKASILNEPQGFVKIVADAETRHPLGVHLVGAHATELIAAACTALGSELDLAAWGRIVHPHPTLSEALSEAVMTTLGEGAHG